MFLAVLSAGVITLAPPIHPMCELVGQQLLIEVRQELITDKTAAKHFERCQRVYPPMSP